MRAPALIAFAFMLVAGCVPRCQADCGGTEQDRLVYARERMHPEATPAQLQLVYEWLLNSTRSCPLSGDLWYYRALLARKLGDAGDVKYSLTKASDNGSTAQGKGFDPLAIVNRAPASSPSKIREKFALVVGVQDMEYSDEMLQFAVRDAHDLGAFLVHSAHFSPNHVKVLTDKQATTQAIREAFGDIRAQAKPDDLVLVYFSSHGSPRKLDPTGLSYVLTYDTDTRTSAKLFSTALQMVELAELGRWVQARDYVLLLDTCYSGAARSGGASVVGQAGSNRLDPLQGLQGSGNRVVISGSRADEVSYEDEDSRHGYFTRFLLEALQKSSSPESLKAVYDFVATHVSTQVAQVAGRQQHPVMESFGEGSSIVIDAPVITATYDQLPSLLPAPVSTSTR